MRPLQPDRHQRRLSLVLAAGVVAAALLVSLFLSEIAHVRLPVHAQIPLYLASFAAARIGGLTAGIIAFGLALGVAAFFLAEPVYDFRIDDLPDFVVFALATGGAA